MPRPTRKWNGPALGVLVFLVGLLLFSWPFWSAPAYRAPGFLFVFLFVVWIGLILVLWLMARAELRSSPPPGQEED
ncbi:MAG: hypothetical protein KJ720_18045 [Proteobacteria bacterium]|nr:hypothetical protein [Pseudomonadota bacterium]MBU1449391.1 hypothetical protein [Pseudomonadota bacterium]MBU2470533.1 hypothetical protein [Pseudomonadota bacterium]MBU2519573.1 hypothetical protein [Pseudomonadota bacterium]